MKVILISMITSKEDSDKPTHHARNFTAHTHRNYESGLKIPANHKLNICPPPPPPPPPSGWLNQKIPIYKSFECKIVHIFLSISFSNCYGCLKEPSPRDGSFEYPQHKFPLRNKFFFSISCAHPEAFEPEHF